MPAEKLPTRSGWAMARNRAPTAIVEYELRLMAATTTSGAVTRAPGRTDAVDLPRACPNATDRLATSPPDGTMVTTSRRLSAEVRTDSRRPAFNSTPSPTATLAVGAMLPNV